MKHCISDWLGIQLASFGIIATLASTCRTANVSSDVASDQAPLQVRMERVPGSVDTWEISLPDRGIVRSGQSAFLSWDVSAKHPDAAIDCGKLKHKVEPIKFENVIGPNNTRYIGFKKKIDPRLTSRCTDSDPATHRKLSLKCLTSGDWDGVKRLEGCLYRDAAGQQLVGKGWGTPGTNGMRPEPRRAATRSLGLADGEAVEDLDVNLNYGKICAQKLGKIPAFDCVKDGQIIPVTKDGVEIQPSEFNVNMQCDKPIYLGLGDQGQCVPYARLGRLPSIMPDGSKNADVDTVFICRRYKMFDQVNNVNVPRQAETPLHEDVAIVQHNRKTGETCWYQALSNFIGGRSLPTSRVPPPYEDELPPEVVTANQAIPDTANHAMAAKDFWIHPSDSQGFQCVGCHDSDPFMFSPYSAQLKYEVSPGVKDYVVPCDPATPQQKGTLATRNTCSKKDGNGLYSQVSKFHSPPNWAVLTAIAPKSNDPAVSGCVSCHRIGNLNTCNSWMPDSIGLPSRLPGDSQKSNLARAFPLNHWMPMEAGKPEVPAGGHHNLGDLVAWERDYKRAADAIAQCCSEWNNGSPTATFNQLCTATQITSTPPVPIVGVDAELDAAPVPAPIPDGNAAGIKIPLVGTIPAGSKVLNASVSINVTHPYIGHLKLLLVKEGEAPVVLFDGSKIPNAATPGLFPESEDLSLNLSSAQVPALNLLKGVAASGNWAIQAIDLRRGDAGEVASLKLKLTVQQAQ